jgi:hypothetical protein
MDSYKVYQLYLSLRLHFTRPDFDITKSRKGVKVSREAFLKRKDLFALRKLAETKTKTEIIDFLVANFVSGNQWGGVFDTEANEVYAEWQTRMQKLGYTFKQDIQTLYAEGDPFEVINGQHPRVLKMYLGKKISLESIAILAKIGIIDNTDYSSLSNDFIWNDFVHLVKKYKPFVKIDKDHYIRQLEQEIGTVVK